MRRRWFWLLNLALILLYLWTLTEEATVRVRVEGGVCTAVLVERPDLMRTSSIPCPDLGGGSVGLYLNDSAGSDPLAKAPLDWLFPRSGWRSITFSELQGQGRQVAMEIKGSFSKWQRLWGEWRPLTPTAVMSWPVPVEGDFEMAVRLRRPEGQAGIVLLEADGQTGRVFIVEPDKRRGAWWQWQDGQLGEPIGGIPFQESLLAQGQSLLRRVLRAQQGALLVLLFVWLAVGVTRRLRHKKPRIFHAAPLRRSWTMTPRHYQIAVAILALLVFAAAAAIASLVLERVPHVQDSITYLFQAQLLAKGKMWAEAPPLPAFFKQEFLIVDNGRWFGQYPPGFPLVLAPGVLLKLPWLINPLLAGATIVLLYLLGQALYDRPTGLIALILAAASPFLLFLSGSLMAHAAELFWVTLFMLSWTHTLGSDKRRWPLLAGLALGMIYLTREATLAAVALPFLAVTALGNWVTGQQRWALAARLGLLLAAAAPLVVLLFLYQNSLTGDPLREPRLLGRPFDRVGFGADIGERNNAFRLEENEGRLQVNWYYDEEQPPRGHSLVRGIYNTEQNWQALAIVLFGWPPVLTLAFVWLVFLRGRPSNADWALLAMCAGTMLIYVFYWASGIMYGPRYYYGALPALLLLTARGIQIAAQWFGREGRAAVALLVAALIAGNLVFSMPRYLDSYRGFNFVSGDERRQVEQAVDGRALVFIENNPLNWWEYGRFFSGNTPWLDGRIIYARDLGEAENGRLRAEFPDREVYRWSEEEGLERLE